MPELPVAVLRLGHRLVRDDRVTTHVGLVARAFGASQLYLVDADPEIKATLDEVTAQWGGPFAVEVRETWKSLLRQWRADGGLVVHLTMYGVPLDDVLPQLRTPSRKLLVVVGAEKTRGELFGLSDFNVAVGNQPHSEVAALAIFLDRWFGGEELKRVFADWKLRIVPTPRGKRVARRV
jgi:tRNA (cytidine56-2'-O)-methyltransferase